MTRIASKLSFLWLAVALCALLGASQLVADHHETQSTEEAEAPGLLAWKAESDRYEADGKFTRWSFTEVDIPEGDLEKGRVVMEVDLASVWEKADGLVEHLKTADFFEVSKYTTATVEIHDAVRQDDGSYQGTATMTLHGNTHDVPIEFQVVSEDPLTIEGTATVSRTRFGIGEPGGSIEDEVHIMLETEVPAS